MTELQQNLLNLDRQGLEAFFAQLGEKSFRASQLMKWIYHQGVLEFDHMTNLSLALRETLMQGATLTLPKIVLARKSRDGTCKWLLRLDDGNSIETVYIPENDRGTLCISSQVGCTLDCSFCATAREGFNRNLTTAEIIGQVLLANQQLRSTSHDRPVTNVVFMGMGEPLLNLTHTLPALSILVDDLGYGLSKRRVTVSTAGIVPAIDMLKESADVALAVSLHASNDELRDELVPVNKKYPITELIQACHRYVQADRKKHITFEYVMLNNINDRPEDARRLIKLLAGLPSKVNLIPFNPFPGSGYTCSPADRIAQFQLMLAKGGLLTTTRKTRGEDIEAACGQLAGDIKDRSRRHIRFQDLRYGEQVSP
ncbi:MAG TPA: 23S rRNA (adenine(2503)-C(2))-methyltransferase RlmN [Gammaproteobacteria bacterium]|nr:23S rRNA (adenine(2503)-C(2))-methyltransferase RlmN [Gammaproteobacteria bacterium]